jgi:hypothetical protein
MKRATLFTLSLAALVLTILPAVASGQAKPKNQLLPNGTVKSVSAGTVVVTALGKDTSFSVDSNTRVVGKGMSTKSRAKADKPSIVDLLKAGDRVTVTYQEGGGARRASKIEVLAR